MAHVVWYSENMELVVNFPKKNKKVIYVNLM